MPHELIISEKPSAAKKLAEALADGKPLKEGDKGVTTWNLTHNGKDIKVACAVGHLYGVAEKEKSFKYPSYDIEWAPAAEMDKSAAHTKKYLNAIKKAAKGADAFTIACDYDIEGEVIGLNIIRYVCKQEDANRMKFSTLTKEDLVKAFENKQAHLDWGQAKAGETRHFLDWLYGINLSRALMTAVKAAGSFKVLSSGRVQGPALKIIVDKEREIQAFVPEPFWQLELHTEKDGQSIVALHEQDKFADEKRAQAAFDTCQGKEPVVESIEEKEFQQAPPTPFSLGDLQAEAYKQFGISPKQTLQIAQSLYLAGATSYPRTSSQKLPRELGYEKILEQLAQQKAYEELASILLSQASLRPNEGKKQDPAHPAIYPTGHRPGKLGERDHKVYDLIVKRFLATFGEPATRKTVTAALAIEDERFIAKGTTTTSPGWHVLYAPYVKLKEQQLPSLSQGEVLEQKDLALLAKETTPPKRYTPAGIISELEKRGLGTKATRADIIEALYKRGYIDEKSIQATELGIKTIATLEKYCPEIIDEELTRSIEDEMEQIREDKTTPEHVLAHAKNELTKTLDKFKQHEQAIGEELIAAERETKDQQSALGSCPKCKDGTVHITQSRKTRKRFAGCSNYPDCDFTASLPQTGIIKATGKLCPHDEYPLISIKARGRAPQELCLNLHCPGKQVEGAKEAILEAEESAHVKKCPKCGKDMKLRKSIYGEFWGCSGYPKCKHTESLDGNRKKNGQEEQKD
ncbi:DNA topoisomerase I [Candidatus Woesearchaeota archaeon]|nr:DNA topoisomerase I [Candidatus Woesearchaeota archaeon]